MTCPYQMMQRAVDIVHSSPHPTNKIAATLLSKDANGNDFIISETNFWPESIEQNFGREGKIGNSSGTIHAETACILHAPITRESSLFITDPPCPNCAKNMAEAGVKNLYIDHKGFEKDFAQRRGSDIQSMSMRIFAAAGISVYVMRRKEQIITPILQIPAEYSNSPALNIIMQKCTYPVNKEHFNGEIAKAQKAFDYQPFALAIGSKNNKKDYSLAVCANPAAGLDQIDDLSAEGKYSFILQPLNRLLMDACDHGLKLYPEYIYCSTVPTSRELVNFLGAGFHQLWIGDDLACRDEDGLVAKRQLENAGILKFLRHGML